MICRHCHTPLQHVFLDLGFAPPSNAYLHVADLHAPELCFPLKLYVCESCWLVQTRDHARADEIFTKDYAYFSPVSNGWLDHARKYCNMITERLQLNAQSFVIEVASNDGYLLENFVADGIPCLGVEPTDSTGQAAASKQTAWTRILQRAKARKPAKCLWTNPSANWLKPFSNTATRSTRLPIFVAFPELSD